MEIEKMMNDYTLYDVHEREPEIVLGVIGDSNLDIVYLGKLFC
jgi:hypothetical protein